MLTKLHLKNFKIFREEEFELAPLTLISGLNGLGKSSIIQSLLLLKQSYEIGYLTSQSKVDLSNDYVNLESAEALLYALETTDATNVAIGLETIDGDKHVWDIDATNPKSKVLNCTHTGTGPLEKLALFQEDFMFLDAERWGPRETYYKKEKRAYNTKLGIQGELAPAYINDALLNNEQIGMEQLMHPSLSSPDLYENLNAWLSDIMSLPVKTRVTELDESRVKLSYQFEGAKGMAYSALQVGFGFTFSMPVILAALRAKKGDLVIVENPEAHLHPSAQVKIGRLLSLAAANGVQIIIESHSDHILNSVRLSFRENILVDGQIKFIHIRNIRSNNGILPMVDSVILKDKGKLSHRPPEFFDEWDRMLTKLL
ncbi:AAA family ATPase [Parapedobacter tibetensis]|uniref:AAA family ATPase n=1 Tax=Parapedobacter tibetensis TaxID=2972951 RepID=UPI00214D9355|nr:AAA family ATPase [Parapedobacter tibetensis]